MKWLVVADEGDLHRRVLLLLGNHHDLGIPSQTSTDLRDSCGIKFSSIDQTYHFDILKIFEKQSRAPENSENSEVTGVTESFKVKRENDGSGAAATTC